MRLCRSGIRESEDLERFSRYAQNNYLGQVLVSQFVSESPHQYLQVLQQVSIKFRTRPVFRYRSVPVQEIIDFYQFKPCTKSMTMVAGPN